METIQFPAGFTWGAASAAYQVEGSPLADGAGPSSWHEFSHRRGTVQDGTTGDVACDHYRRYREDVALVRQPGAHGQTSDKCCSAVRGLRKFGVIRLGLLCHGIVHRVLNAMKPANWVALACLASQTSRARPLVGVVVSIDIAG